MRRIIYKWLTKLPGQLVSVGSGLIGLVATFKPDWVKEWADAGMSADTIQYIGVALIAWAFFHVLLLWLLKPGETTSAANMPSQSSTGDSSPNLAGTFGDVHISNVNEENSNPPEPFFELGGTRNKVDIDFIEIPETTGPGVRITGSHNTFTGKTLIYRGAGSVIEFGNPTPEPSISDKSQKYSLVAPTLNYIERTEHDK